MCWRQFQDVGEGFDPFGHQHPLSLNISVGHQHPKDLNSVANILKLPPTVRHQLHNASNMTVANRSYDSFGTSNERRWRRQKCW